MATREASARPASSSTPADKQGRLEWIGLRPARRAPVEAVREAVVEESRGLHGDHHRHLRGVPREVTLVQHEHLAQIAALLDRGEVPPGLLRRNLAVSGIDLAALERRVFRIGEVVLEGTGPCTPCARMDEALGDGGRKAMKGRGGITARVLRGGTIRVGDTVAAAQTVGDTGAADHGS
jgi:MOSC domain-containing protein YiiM